MALQIHMQKRNGSSSWYFRRRIPKDLLDHYTPKKEIWESLETTDRKEAERNCREASSKWDAEFESVRRFKSSPLITDLAPDQINLLVTAWKTSLLEEDEEARIEGLSDKDYDKYSEALEIVETGGKHSLARGDTSLIEFEMMDFCEAHGYKLDKNSPLFKTIAYAFMKASIEVNLLLQKRHQGEIVETPLAPNLSNSSNTTHDKETQTIQGLFEYWLTQPSETSGKKKSRSAEAEARTVIKKFIAINGDIHPDQVTAHHAVTLKDSMLEANLAAGTINKSRGILAAIFSCAAANSKIKTNPFAELKKLKIPKSEVEKPYETAELQTIFSSKVFTEGYRPTAGRGEAAFWLPLLALFTGARLNELGQTYVDDVGTENNIPYILIRPEGATNRAVKDDKRRRVPLHHFLIELGFIDYVREVKRKGDLQVFPELKASRTGGKLADKWGSWWSSYVREELNIKRVPKPFHGFRHTFIAQCRRDSVGYEARIYMEGHADKTVASTYGDSLFPLEPLKKEIEKITYSGLDLSKIKLKQP